MNEDLISQKAKQALRHIRNGIMHNGKAPSVRQLMNLMEYKSSRSALLLMEELIANGFLEKKQEGGVTLLKDLDFENTTRTVLVPLVGIVACGTPLFAEENTEAMISVSLVLARPGSKYFLLRAKGDSMDKAGINDGDLLLVKQQSTAYNGQNVIALIDDEATVKEFHLTEDVVSLLPRSTNPKHQQIIVSNNFQIQGIIEAIIPKVTN